MPYVKIWIHAVWTTKKRRPLLKKEIRSTLFRHIRENAIDKGILIDIVGGHLDHVHCLFRLKNDQTVSKIMQMIKGEASFWANKNLSLKEKIQWQEEYFAISINESGLTNVRNYIANQEDHHKKAIYQEEYDDFMLSSGFKDFKNK
jgi:REP element-mobilizing transposase RayT